MKTAVSVIVLSLGLGIGFGLIVLGLGLLGIGLGMSWKASAETPLDWPASPHPYSMIWDSSHVPNTGEYVLNRSWPWADGLVRDVSVSGQDTGDLSGRVVINGWGVCEFNSTSGADPQKCPDAPIHCGNKVSMVLDRSHDIAGVTIKIDIVYNSRVSCPK